MDKGHHGLGERMAVPDYRSYCVEDAPELVRIRDALECKGLKDPWLRNEVWRYRPSEWGTTRARLRTFFFRGFSYGWAAFMATIVVEKGIELATGGDH